MRAFIVERYQEKVMEIKEKEYVKDILLTNIQRFSLHDGPGIRTTVFLKGCSLRCPWCSNPENLAPFIQTYMKDEIKGVYGKYYNWADLYIEIIKDISFFSGEIIPANFSINKEEDLDKLPGGVTFSGGEALLQVDKLVPLLIHLKDKGIHMAVETSLFVNEWQLDMAIKYIDLFYVDIKILDSNRAMKIYHGEVDQYKINFGMLMRSKTPVVLRVPVIGGYTDDEMNRKAVIEFIKKYHSFHGDLYSGQTKEGNILKVELIKEHNLGLEKYYTLNYPKPDYKGISDDLLEMYKREIEKETGLKTEICKI